MMTFEQIMSNLKKKIYHPVYFLMGDEPYYIDIITNYILENVLAEAERSFNQVVLYGKETNVSTLIDTARRFPMMANHQVVIVKEAQNISNLEQLKPYLDSPLKSTLLVINYKYGKVDKRTKFYKDLTQKSALLISNKIYESEIPEWINKYIESKNKTISPEARVLLKEYLGNDLTKVANELEKLLITLPINENKITIEHIEKNIGISKDFNTFELSAALSRKEVIKANRIVNYFKNNPRANPIVRTIASLYFFFSKVLAYYYIKDKSNRRVVASTLKVNPYFLKDYESAAKLYGKKKTIEIISLLREYDTRSKGKKNVSTSEGELLKELIYKILH